MALTPEVTVTNASGDVVDESNYTLAWSNHVNAWDAASVTVSGIKDYAGVKTQTFTIDARDINTALPAYTTPVPYQKPADPTEPGIISEPTLTYNGRTLKKALRPAELVGRRRQKIDAVQRDGQVSRSLHSVNVQQHIRLTAERCQRGDVLYNAYLVVGVLQADQVGVGRQGAGQALRYNAAEPVNLQRCHAAAVVPD